MADRGRLFLLHPDPWPTVDLPRPPRHCEHKAPKGCMVRSKGLRVVSVPYSFALLRWLTHSINEVTGGPPNCSFLVIKTVLRVSATRNVTYRVVPPPSPLFLWSEGGRGGEAVVLYCHAVGLLFSEIAVEMACLSKLIGFQRGIISWDWYDWTV